MSKPVRASMLGPVAAWHSQAQCLAATEPPLATDAQPASTESPCQIEFARLMHCVNRKHEMGCSNEYRDFLSCLHAYGVRTG